MNNFARQRTPTYLGLGKDLNYVYIIPCLMCCFLRLYAVFRWFLLLFLSAPIHQKIYHFVLWFYILHFLHSWNRIKWKLAVDTFWQIKWLPLEIGPDKSDDIIFYLLLLTAVTGSNINSTWYEKVDASGIQYYLPAMMIMNYFCGMVVALNENNYTRTFDIYERNRMLACAVNSVNVPCASDVIFRFNVFSFDNILPL